MKANLLLNCRPEKNELPTHRDNSSWKKLKLLLWKNYTIQMRHKWQTLLELLIPVIFTAALVGIRVAIKPDDHPETTYYDSIAVTKPPYNTLWRW